MILVQQTELPDSWLRTRIGDLMRIRSGHAFKSSDYCASGIPLIRQSNLSGSSVNIDSAVLLPRNFLDRFPEFRVVKGDLLIGMSGSIGKVAKYEFEQVALQNQRTGLVVAHGGIDVRIIELMFRFIETQLLGLGKGIAVQNISSNDIENCLIPVPPLGEQPRIVAEVEKQFTRLDAAVEALKRIRVNLRRYRASVLKAACEGRLVPTEAELARAEERDYEPADVLLQRIAKERRAKWEAEEASRLKPAGGTTAVDALKSKYKQPIGPDLRLPREAPEGWAWATVEQLSLRVQYGTSAKTGSNRDGIPVVRMCNIFDGRLLLCSLKYLPSNHREFPELLLEEGDVLFNRTNSAELVGKTAVYRGVPNPCSFASYLIRVHLASDCVPDFMAYYLNSLLGRSWIASVVSQQVGQANVNGTKLQSFAVALPPLPEQYRIVTEVERRVSVIAEVEAQVNANLKRAERLRQSILKRAVEGKLVPQDPNDEPASVLLERIRTERAAKAELTASHKGSIRTKRKRA